MINLSCDFDAGIARSDDFVVLDVNIPGRDGYKDTIRLALEDGVLIASSINIHKERNATLRRGKNKYKIRMKCK